MEAKHEENCGSLPQCEHAGGNSSFYHYISSVSHSQLFTAFFLLIIVLDSVFIAHLIDPTLKEVSAFFKIADKLFLTVYLLEIFIKVYVDPLGFCRSPNILSAIILMVSCICVIVIGHPIAMRNVSVLRAFLTVRFLTVLSHKEILQVLAAAYWKATKIVVHFVGWIFVVLVIFSVVGHDLYADLHIGDPDSWGDLDTSLMTLFSLTALDDWTDVQQRFDDLNMDFSWIFTITIIITVPFVLIKIIIGVYTSEMTNTSVRIEKSQKIEMNAKMAHKHLLNQEHEKEMKELLQKQADSNRDRDFECKIGKIELSLSHDNIIVTESQCTSLFFIQMCRTAVSQQNDTVIELQHLYSEMLHVLGEILEDKLN